MRKLQIYLCCCLDIPFHVFINTLNHFLGIENMKRHSSGGQKTLVLEGGTINIGPTLKVCFLYFFMFS